MIPLKYQTSSQKRVIGQIISTDGNTITSSGTTIASTDIRIWKYNSTALVSKSTSGATYLSDGVWSVTFSSDDTDTLGAMIVFTHISSGLVTKDIFDVMAANKYDSWVSTTDYLDVNAITISSGAISSVTMSSGAISTLTISTAAWDLSALSVWSESTKSLTDRSSFSLSTTARDNITNDVWQASTRSLTSLSSFNLSTIERDAIAAVTWTYSTRGLSSASYDTISDVVWANSTRTLSSGGAVWSAATRSLTDYSSCILSTAGRDAVVDAIWDEARADHISTLSIGYTQSTLYSMSMTMSTADYDSISDVVWDEARSGHVSTLSMGYTQSTLYTIPAAAISTTDYDEISSVTWSRTVRTLSTTQSFDVTGNITGNLSGSVGSVTDRSSFAVSTINQDAISNAVWNNSTKLLSSGAAVWSAATRTLTDMSSVSLSAAAYSTLVDMIWDEARSGHVSTLSVGFTQSTLNWSYQSSVVWNEVLTGATHNIATSAGRRLREITSNIIHSGTATAGDAISITLDAAASTTDSSYDPSLIYIVSGTGVGQSRGIFEYYGATKVAVVDRDWKINPDNTSEFIIVSDRGREHTNEGLAQAGSSNTLTLNTLASTEDDIYKDQIIFIRAGVGQDQVGIVIDYDGATKIATVHPDWRVTPSSESVYAMLPYFSESSTDIATNIWQYSTRTLSTTQSFDLTGDITGNLSGSVNSVSSAVALLTDRSSFALSTTAIDAIYTAYIESTETVKDTLKIIRAESAGASTGGGGSTAVFYSPNSSVARITATVSSDGNRNIPTFNLT